MKMIGRAHIVTFSIIAAMYLIVGIWKYAPGTSESDDQIPAAQESDREEILKFWEAYNTATAYRSQRDYKLAALYYSNALEINDSHEDALYYLASMHLFMKDFKETEKQLLRLEELKPGAPRTQLQLGTLYFCMDGENNLNDLEEAKNRFETAWNLNREETGTPLMLSKIHLLQNDIDKMEPLLNVVTASNKMSYQALFLKGYVNWKNGDEKRALNNLQSAIKLYQSLAYADVRGEGATEAGAQAMLSEDRFCDGFELKIDEHLSLAYSYDMTQHYIDFDNELRSLQKSFQ